MACTQSVSWDQEISHMRYYFLPLQKYLTYLGISIILVLRRNYYYSCTGEEIVPSDELKFRVFKMIYMPTYLFYITT